MKLLIVNYKLDSAVEWKSIEQDDNGADYGQFAEQELMYVDNKGGV